MSFKDIYYQVYENSAGSSGLSPTKTKNLVLLHGFMGSTLDWNFLVNFLLTQSTEPLKIISILLPGHTQEVSNSLENNLSKNAFSKIQNPVNSSNNTLQKLAKQILEIQKKEEALDCCYLGYSMGGRVAIELASLNHHTETLILESSFTHWKNKEDQQIKKTEDLNLLKSLLENNANNSSSKNNKSNASEKNKNNNSEDFFCKNFKSFLLQWYDLELFKGLPQNKNFPLLLKTRLQQNVKHLHEALQVYSSGTVDSYLNILKNLNCPIFYIYGEHDTKYKAIGLNLKKIISFVNLQEVKNASHNTHFQQTLNFGQTILKILS